MPLSIQGLPRLTPVGVNFSLLCLTCFLYWQGGARDVPADIHAGFGLLQLRERVTADGGNASADRRLLHDQDQCECPGTRGESDRLAMYLSALLPLDAQFALS